MSSAPLRVFLTRTQEETLFELSKASGVPQRTKNRASALRLSSMGWKVEKIAIYLKCSKPTVRETIHRWNQQGLMGLWDGPKTGRKRKWQPEDFREIERRLETEQRTYNSRQLVELLKTERQVSLSERHLRRILKKKLEMEKNEKVSQREAKSHRAAKEKK